MQKSSAKTVKEYLDRLPTEKSRVLSEVRKVVRKNLPKGYKETLNWGMISYEVPLSRYPDTYNKEPLCFAMLAAQKSHYALYLMNVYQDPKLEEQLRSGFAKAGKQLDMGKSCIRFKSLEDLPLELIGKVVASTPVEKFIARYERNRNKP